MAIRAEPVSPLVPLRPPEEVMRLSRLGAFHQTRLSFLRALLRRARAGRWVTTRPLFDFDARGVGTAVYRVDTGSNVLSLVAFGHDLPPEKRTDRVIAEAWDATFALYDGDPTPEEIERLRRNVPLQEAGRYGANDLVLARANRSVRLFDTVLGALAAGSQPTRSDIEAVGYLMRTTAVYGNGKFGIADRDRIADRPDLAGPFRAEMLTVWLIRAFTVDLVEHMAALASPGAVALDPDLRRRIGVGNATGLGMAPFLVKHPALIDCWVRARETALARVRALPGATPEAKSIFLDALGRARRALPLWSTDDDVQRTRIGELAQDLERLQTFTRDEIWSAAYPWEAIWQFAGQALSIEGQEMVVSLLLEPHGALIDDLADTMAIDEAPLARFDGRGTVGDLKAKIERRYKWALQHDYDAPAAVARFWYVSEEKLEPRIGERASEAGSDREQPLAVARDIARLHQAIAKTLPERQLADFLLEHPEHRHVTRRVAIADRHPYGEIRDNLLAGDVRPIDMLRAKLSFFGCTRFDPRSDKWLRITLFQGAPFPHEIGASGDEPWPFGPPDGPEQRVN